MLFFTIAPWLHLLKTTVRYASRCRQAVPESVAGVGTASMSLSHQCESAAGSGVGACSSRGIFFGCARHGTSFRR